MLMMVEKGIRRGICNATIGMQKQITSIWKILIKALNHHT